MYWNSERLHYYESNNPPNPEFGLNIVFFNQKLFFVLILIQSFIYLPTTWNPK